MAKFLDNTGLTYLWGKIKTALANKMDKSNPSGTGSFSLNRKSGTTVGTRSFVEGDSNSAAGTNAHSEGSNNQSDGDNSHTEGNDTWTVGNNSHAEGLGTIAGSANQHVSGKYNIYDNHSKYAEIIGNGSDTNNRSDARTLDWNGNERLAGGQILYAGTANELDVASAIDAVKPSGFVTDSTPSAISVSSSNDWQCLSTTPFIQAGAGELWMFEVALEIQSNASGLRGIGVSNSTTTAPSVIWKQQVRAVSGAVTNLVLSSFAKPTNGASYYIWVRQDSGSTLNVTYRYRAVKLS